MKKKTITLTLDEYNDATYKAFQLGTRVAMDATQEVLQLGPTRIDRIYTRLLQLQLEMLQTIANGGDWDARERQTKTAKTEQEATSSKSSSKSGDIRRGIQPRIPVGSPSYPYPAPEGMSP